MYVFRHLKIFHDTQVHIALSGYKGLVYLDTAVPPFDVFSALYSVFY